EPADVRQGRTVDATGVERQGDGEGPTGAELVEGGVLQVPGGMTSVGADQVVRPQDHAPELRLVVGKIPGDASLQDVVQALAEGEHGQGAFERGLDTPVA